MMRLQQREAEEEDQHRADIDGEEFEPRSAARPTEPKKVQEVQ